MKNHYEELLAKISPKLAIEARRRLEAEEAIAFLPSQVRMKKGRIWFPEEIGWVPAPAFDPAKVPVKDIELIFVMRTTEGAWTQIEVVMR